MIFNKSTSAPLGVTPWFGPESQSGGGLIGPLTASHHQQALTASQIQQVAYEASMKLKRTTVYIDKASNGWVITMHAGRQRISRLANSFGEIGDQVIAGLSELQLEK